MLLVLLLVGGPLGVDEEARRPGVALGERATLRGGLREGETVHRHLEAAQHVRPARRGRVATRAPQQGEARRGNRRGNRRSTWEGAGGACQAART